MDSELDPSTANLGSRPLLIDSVWDSFCLGQEGRVLSRHGLWWEKWWWWSGTGWHSQPPELAWLHHHHGHGRQDMETGWTLGRKGCGGSSKDRHGSAGQGHVTMCLAAALQFPFPTPCHHARQVKACLPLPPSHLPTSTCPPPPPKTFVCCVHVQHALLILQVAWTTIFMCRRRLMNRQIFWKTMSLLLPLPFPFPGLRLGLHMRHVFLPYHLPHSTLPSSHYYRPFPLLV